MHKRNRKHSYRLNDPIPEKKPVDPKIRKKRHHRAFFTIVILLAIILGGAAIIGKTTNQAYDQANSPSAIMAYNKSNQNSKQFTYEYYWKPGCPDCHKVNKAGIQNLLKQATHKNNVVAINTTKFKNQPSSSGKIAAHQWFANNYITQVPSLIVKYQGKPIYLYSGTNIKVYKKMLKGINPKTNQPFKHTSPVHETYQNDFDHARQNFISVNPTENNNQQN